MSAKAYVCKIFKKAHWFGAAAFQSHNNIKSVYVHRMHFAQDVFPRCSFYSCVRYVCSKTFIIYVNLMCAIFSKFYCADVCWICAHDYNSSRACARVNLVQYICMGRMSIELFVIFVYVAYILWRICKQTDTHKHI